MSEEVVEGQKVRIRFDGSKCIHSRNCVLGLPQVFRANVEGPWIHPDAAEPGEVMALAARCPSGAVVAERLDGVPNETPSGRNVVAVLENGPYTVRGDLRLAGKSAGNRLTLCRCGASKNKPYCDHSHVDAQFKATGEPTQVAGGVPDWGPAGPLKITPAPNGPLIVAGSHEVTCGTGRTVQRANNCALCRCGGSNNKPFCDGTHARIGFVAK